MRAASGPEVTLREPYAGYGAVVRRKSSASKNKSAAFRDHCPYRYGDTDARASDRDVWPKRAAIARPASGGGIHQRHDFPIHRPFLLVEQPDNAVHTERGGLCASLYSK